MYSHDWRAVSCIMFKNAVPHVFWPYRIPWVVWYRLVHFRAPASHISLHLYSPWELFTSIETLAIQHTEQHWASRLDWPQIRGNMIPPSWVSVRLQAITGKFQPFSPGTHQPLKRIHRWNIRAGPRCQPSSNFNPQESFVMTEKYIWTLESFISLPAYLLHLELENFSNLSAVWCGSTFLSFGLLFIQMSY